jgi:hypothetical protein
MAMEGLMVLVCAVVGAGPAGAATTADERESAVTATLAVQTAMQQAREALLHNDCHAAVEVLEGQLSRINGNQAYLALLRDAYRAYVRELRLANRDEAAQVYERRLGILDRGPPSEASAAQARPMTAFQKVLGLGQGLMGGSRNAPAAPPPAETPAPKPSTVRAHGEDDEDPFRQPALDQRKVAHELLARAEQEFANRHFREAGQLFEQASRADRNLSEGNREQWAYCKLHRVVDQLNQSDAGGPAAAELESEVRLALTLAPRLDYGRTLLRELESRRGGAPSGAGRPEEPPAQLLAVRHLGRSTAGWAVAETANFRVFHNQSPQLAEQAAQVAERTRWAMQRKWFGANGPDWNPKCELFLHATASDYNRVTGAPGGSPGHSSFHLESGRVVSRRIDLHCDNPNMLLAVLPHETTHTVLAGNFGDKPVPRWVDEGVAVLTEPRDKVELHLRNLPRHRQERQLFPVSQLMQMNDYPEPRAVGPFYAESVSLVEFLASQKEPQVFTQFVREGMRTGYEAALQRYYGYQSFNDLEARWVQHAFGEGGASPGVALATP